MRLTASIDDRIDPSSALRQPAANTAPRGMTKESVAVLASSGRYRHYLSRSLLNLMPLAFAAAVFLALSAGWTYRDEGHLTAESGLGYWLGIAGASMMLLLMLYPLRKRIRALRVLGSVPSWFRIHMMLGILGPVLIIFHTNFHLGSLNSNVALVAMLIVVASGVVGRYLYAKVHKGLYGSTLKVREVFRDAASLKLLIGAEAGQSSQIAIVLQKFEDRAQRANRSFLTSVWHFFSIGFLIMLERPTIARELDRLVSQEAKAGGLGYWERRKRRNAVREHLRLYFAAIRKAARFAVYERLLAAWHVLHLPLFILLFITAVIHVIAVHQY